MDLPIIDRRALLEFRFGLEGKFINSGRWRHWLRPMKYRSGERQRGRKREVKERRSVNACIYGWIEDGASVADEVWYA